MMKTRAALNTRNATSKPNATSDVADCDTAPASPAFCSTYMGRMHIEML